MTAAEIYETMDACMESCKSKTHSEILPTVLSHAAKLGREAGRTQDDILKFYFMMRDLNKGLSGNTEF